MKRSIPLMLGLVACTEPAYVIPPTGPGHAPPPPSATNRVEHDDPPPPPAPAPSTPPQAGFAGWPTIETRTMEGGPVVARIRRGGALAIARLVVPAGGEHDRPGVAALTAKWVAEGSAARGGAARFAERLRDLGASVRVHAGARTTHFSLAVPGERLADAVDALASMIGPRASAAGFRPLRRRAIDRATARARDDDRWVADELAQRALAAGGDETSRRANAGTASELSRVRPTHAAAFYQAHYHPARVRIETIGSAPIDTLTAAAKRGFGDRPRRPPKALKPAKAWDPSAPSTVVHLVDRPLATNAVVHLATRQGGGAAVGLAADHLAEAWRTGQAAALGMELRSVAAPGRPTVRIVRVEAPTDRVAEAIHAARKLMERKPESNASLPRTQAVGSFERALSSARGLDRWWRRAAARGAVGALPKLHLALRRTGAPQVARAATLDARGRVVVVFGDAVKLAPVLAGIGQVRNVRPRVGFKRRKR